MIQSKMEENYQDLVCSMNHKLPIIMINLEKNVENNKRLLCEECIKNQYQVSSFNNILQIISKNQEEKRNQVNYVIEANSQKIEQLQNEIHLLKSSIIQYLDSLVNETYEWRKSLENKGQQLLKYKFQEELEKEFKERRYTLFSCKPLIDEINNINQQCKQKIISKLNLFEKFQGYQKCHEILINIENMNQQLLIQEQKEQNNNQQEQIIQENYGQIEQNLEEEQFILELIDDTNNQGFKCSAIVFDKTGSIMISNEKANIKIWNFTQGRIQLLNNYKIHKNNVNCLVYSKQINSFISGSDDHTIICWKQINNNEWISSQPIEQHEDSVLCLTLNKSEDQLISGGQDMQIIIWKVNLDNNELKFLYPIAKHVNQVRQLNFNQSETLLASCALGQIIIWQKGATNQWEVYQIINELMYGFKIQFIDDLYLLWVPYDQNQDNILVFKQQNGKFEEQYDSLIQLNQNIECDDDDYFPIIYNQEVNYLLIRHKHKIYIIKHLHQNQFKIKYTQDCGINIICGALTENGQYLVLFDEKKKQYLTYKILKK